MKKGNLKIFIFYSIFFLFLFLFFLYNKNTGKIFATEYKLNCNVKIPIGEVIDESEELAMKIIDATESIIQTTSEVLNIGGELKNLPDQCKSENCHTGCNQRCENIGYKDCGQTNIPCCSDQKCFNECQKTCYSYQCGSYICGNEPCGKDEKGNTIFCPKYCPIYCLRCMDYKGKCEIISCYGEPCPLNEIQILINRINENYKKIELVYKGDDREKKEGIIKLTKKPQEIFSKLGEVRNKLKSCTSPTEDYQKYLSVEEFPAKFLLNCPNAKTYDENLSDCHPNNYFCCE